MYIYSKTVAMKLRVDYAVIILSGLTGLLQFLKLLSELRLGEECVLL